MRQNKLKDVEDAKEEGADAVDVAAAKDADVEVDARVRDAVGEDAAVAPVTG